MRLDQPPLLRGGRGDVEVLFTLQPEAGFTSLSAGTLDELGGHEEAKHGDKGEGTSIGGLSAAASDVFENSHGVALDATNFLPLPVAGDSGTLSTVDELSQRDICVVTEDVDVLEAVRGTVLEFDAEEVAEIGGRSTAQLNSNGRCVVGEAAEFRVVLGDAGLVEERNEWLVASFDQQELQGVAVESDALKRCEDGVHESATSNVTDTADIIIRENSILVEVGETASLLMETGGKAMRVGLVVGELGLNEIVDIPDVLESSRTAKNVIFDTLEERFCGLSFLLELGRSIEFFGMLLEVRAVGPAL